MASSWRRLASAVGRTVPSTACRSRVVPLLSCCVEVNGSSRNGGVRSLHTGLAVRGTFTESRFWKWLNDEPDPADFMGDEERLQRQALLQKVQDMYFAKPPVIPGLDFYKEVFESLIKHNDRVGVKTLWHFMQEMNVRPDTELTSMVEPYLEDLQRNVWFE